MGVRHIQDRDRALHVPSPEIVDDAGLRTVIEAGERLVQQQRARVGDKRPRQRDPLLLAARDLRRSPTGQVSDAEGLEHRASAIRALRGRQVGQAVFHIPLHGEMRKEREMLGYVSDGPARHGNVCACGGVEEHRFLRGNPTGVGPCEPGDGAQHGGLAAAGGAEEDRDAGRHGEIHVDRERPGDALPQQDRQPHGRGATAQTLLFNPYTAASTTNEKQTSRKAVALAVA